MQGYAYLWEYSECCFVSDVPSTDSSLTDMYVAFQDVRETNLQEVSTAESRRQASFLLVLQSLKSKCKE